MEAPLDFPQHRPGARLTAFRGEPIQFDLLLRFLHGCQAFREQFTQARFFLRRQ